MNIEIEEVLEDNISLIHEMAHEVWPETFKNILSNEQIAYMMNMMYSIEALKNQLKNNCRFLVAQQQQKNVGFASFEVGYMNNPNCTKLHKIYILTQYQRSGFGKLLIKEIEKIAKDNVCTTLSLNVNRYNTAAIAAYEKLSFKVTKQEDINIGNGYLMEDFVMEKSLLS
ncbi:GNAT family N-acetyltransferase [Neptunitalea lumnitzerae]|uniref:N-acetyltransferase n=1 Tax=Neptunitalea lumnitzerae TaxID=2965509 RepID=A0ABQ5MFJ0_9FLAO|nr:GNAT family N-acetyltransferase [Neptunitalea sp. Y10]GLB48186.1 N-acetyltransferase [Neptunitalea sp. Y10]